MSIDSPFDSNSPFDGDDAIEYVEDEYVEDDYVE